MLSWLYEHGRPLIAFVIAAAAVFGCRRLSFRRQGRQAPCDGCGGGYRILGLPMMAFDGRLICLQCPRCRTFYGVETASARVLKIEARTVKERWPRANDRAYGRA